MRKSNESLNEKIKKIHHGVESLDRQIDELFNPENK